MNILPCEENETMEHIEIMPTGDDQNILNQKHSSHFLSTSLNLLSSCGREKADLSYMSGRLISILKETTERKTERKREKKFFQKNNVLKSLKGECQNFVECFYGFILSCIWWRGKS